MNKPKFHKDDLVCLVYAKGRPLVINEAIKDNTYGYIYSFYNASYTIREDVIERYVDRDLINKACEWVLFNVESCLESDTERLRDYLESYANGKHNQKVEEIIKTDFYFRESSYDNRNLIEHIEQWYDKIKSLSLDKIKELLPINYVGPYGTYFIPDSHVHEANQTKYFPFTLTGEIWCWYGDRSTCSFIEACANTEEELYQRLLMLYLDYLLNEYLDEAKKITDKIENGIKL